MSSLRKKLPSVLASTLSDTPALRRADHFKLLLRSVAIGGLKKLWPLIFHEFLRCSDWRQISFSERKPHSTEIKGKMDEDILGSLCFAPHMLTAMVGVLMEWAGFIFVFLGSIDFYLLYLHILFALLCVMSTVRPETTQTCCAEHMDGKKLRSASTVSTGLTENGAKTGGACAYVDCTPRLIHQPRH